MTVELSFYESTNLDYKNAQLPFPFVTQAMTGSMSYLAPTSSVPSAMQSMPQVVSAPQYQPQVTTPSIVSQP